MKQNFFFIGILLLISSCAHLTQENAEEMIQKVLAENKVSLHECTWDRGGELVGTVDLSFRILPNGSTSQISVKKSKSKKKSNLEQRDLDCVANKVAHFSFPSFSEKDFPEKYIEVNFPLNFIPRPKSNN